MTSVRVAVVQAAPILFNREATIDKACALIREAADQGARIMVFPEAFVPAYPRGLSFGVVVGHRQPEGRELYARYWSQSMTADGPEAARLGEAAAAAQSYLAIGVIERDEGVHAGTLYCTTLYFGPDGRLLGKHRKLKPTAAERLIWGEGDGSTLTVCETPFGGLGGLICWENYMPLARAALYAKSVDIYVAPTADARDAWQATMRHIALEGRCFVLGCNQYVTKDMYPDDLRAEIADMPDVLCRGGSVIVSPLGEVLAGPNFEGEAILTADLDLDEIVRARFDFDVVGHYARPDVFSLRVDERPKG